MITVIGLSLFLGAVGVGDLFCFAAAMMSCCRRHGSLERWNAIPYWLRMAPCSGYWLLFTKRLR